MHPRFCVYTKHGRKFAKHDTVTHQKKECVRHEDDQIATTNASEGFLGICKRCISGTHHRIGVRLPLYFTELDFKYNERKVSDGERAKLWMARLGGRRLTYPRIDASKAVAKGITVAATTPKE